jgi:hypothetical protein
VPNAGNQLKKLLAASDVVAICFVPPNARGSLRLFGRRTCLVNSLCHLSPVWDGGMDTALKGDREMFVPYFLMPDELPCTWKKFGLYCALPTVLTIGGLVLIGGLIALATPEAKSDWSPLALVALIWLSLFTCTLYQFVVQQVKIKYSDRGWFIGLQRLSHSLDSSPK